MEKVIQKLWALSFVAIGVFLMLSLKVSVTGAVVGTEISFVIGSLFAFALVLAGLIWYAKLH